VDRKFSIVSGQRKTRSYHTGDEKQWVCSRCEVETGVAPSTLERFEEILSPVFNATGELTGGTRRKGLRCATCKTVVTSKDELLG
jgi:hypothetical protein